MRISSFPIPLPIRQRFSYAAQPSVTQPFSSLSVRFGGSKRTMEEAEKQEAPDVFEPSDLNTAPPAKKARSTRTEEALSTQAASRRLLSQPGLTPLMSAARYGYLTELDQMLTDPVTAALLNKQDPSGRTALHYAVESQQYGAIENLMKYGAQKDIPDEQSQTPVTLAAKAGDITSLGLLCKDDVDLNPVSLLGKVRFPLTTAVKHNQPNAVAFLLEKGAHPDGEGAFTQRQTYRGKTPLMQAAAKNFPQLINMLIAKGAEPDVKNFYGNTALDYAAARQHWEATQALLRQHANPATALYDLEDMLLSAAENNEFEKLAFLIQHGVPLNTDKNINRMVYQFTLQAAAIANDLKTARLLLNHGIEPDADADNDKPSLVLAAEQGHEAMVRLLLAHNADIDNQLQTDDDEGQTALHKAVRNNHAALAEYLLAQGASLEMADAEGRTAYTHAIQAGHNELAKLLHTQYGAKMEWDFLENLVETTPMIAAAIAGNLDMLDFMISRGVDVNTANIDAETPLMYAKDLSTARKLITAGADLEFQDLSENRPLMLHACTNNIAVMRWLLSQGANINATNENWQTALYQAAAHHHPEAVDLLLRHNAELNKTDDDDRNAIMAAILHPPDSPDTGSSKDMGEAARGKILESLLQHGEHVNHLDGNLESALMMAAKCLLPTSTEILLKHGARTRNEDEDEDDRGTPSALTLAAEACISEPSLPKAGLDVLKQLIKADPDDAKDNVTLHQLIHRTLQQTAKALFPVRAGHPFSREQKAEWRKHFQEFRQLIEAGVPIEQAMPDVVTTLGDSAKLGETVALEFLLKAGIPPDATFSSTQTALMQASRFGQTEAADILLGYGANPDYTDPRGKTPFQSAIQKGCLNTMLRLLQAGADPAPHLQTEEEVAETDAEKRRKDRAITWPLRLRRPDVAEYVNSQLSKQKHQGRITWNLQTRNRKSQQAQAQADKRFDTYPV